MFSCNLSAQKESKEAQEDKNLNKIVNQVNANLNDNKNVQKAIVEKSDKIVTQAANTITSLKAEVGTLKNQINETKKNDSVNNIVDTSNKFQLRPISIGEKNR
jgi:FtsZ-binding cell division protein ZapB